MSVDVTFTVAGEAYYVIAITNSRDAVNEFFEFDIDIRHADELKLLACRVRNAATLLIGDLTYECEIVARHYTLITDVQAGGESGQQLKLALRPWGWSRLSHQAMRVFEVSDALEDPLNLAFPAVITLAELTRLLNQSAIGEDSGFTETAANTELGVFRIDWWQNQLLVQIQETNAEAFTRLVWKMGASFFYHASQSDHIWLTVPDLLPVPVQRIVLTEDDLSQLTSHTYSVNRFARWYRDQFTQINHMSDSSDTIGVNQANQQTAYQQVKLQSHKPLSCDQVYEYTPTRRDHEKMVFIPLEVSHSYHHRTGYHCTALAQNALTEAYFDLSVLDETPQPFLTPLIATIHSDSEQLAGDRDSQMRYRVRFDFAINVEQTISHPKAWLFRLRPSSSNNGAGAYEPMPVGTKVVIQMLNGDREQPVIANTFLTKHGKKSV
jgi:hypothetical protein